MVRVIRNVLAGGSLVAVAGLVLILVLWRLKRRAPALRLALVIAPFAFLLTAWSMRHVSETVVMIEPAYAAFLLALPVLSLLLGAGGLVWIARHWRAVAANTCAECTHALLPDQTRCPECGAPGVSADLPMRTRRQRRVLWATLLAFLSAVAGFFSIEALGDATLPWRANVMFVVVDEAERPIFGGWADAVTVASALNRQAEPGYGPGGGIRALSNAVIEDLHALRNSTPSARIGVAVLPPEGVSVDDPWFDSVERSLERRPPEFARAGLSWARTVSSRLRGDEAQFDLAIAEVYSILGLQRPAGWRGAVLPFAGLIVALAVGATAMLLSRRWPRAARHAP